MGWRHGGWLLAVVSGLLVGCENTVANPAGHVMNEDTPRLDVTVPGVAPTSSPLVLPHAVPLQTSRTISRDDDADGLVDYRAVITETFDAAGNLLSRTKAQDFDADGIVDSRVTTTFDGRVPAP